MKDLLILTKIKNGDVKAFEQVFRLYYMPLCMYAAGITGRMDIAEEIVQELFYVFWKERERLQLFHTIKSYLYGAVRNQSLQYREHQDVRNRYRDAVLSHPDKDDLQQGDPQEQIEYKELEALINRTLQKLPERRLRIFRMHRFEGKKYAEIASLLSLSVKTVEAEMTKALRTLRNELEIYMKL
ncbi:MAG: RNA polymerase sigma-70 factor [Parabacteroides sp.]|nr:RNA polymerase sigma-70 factor [Parabacteroides sp.]